jgi:hypothetical protein
VILGFRALDVTAWLLTAAGMAAAAWALLRESYGELTVAPAHRDLAEATA